MHYEKEPSGNLVITKASGDRVAFSEEKLRHSLEKTGADDVTVNDVVEKVINKLYEGISTKRVYQLAFKELKKHSRLHAGRYNIKKAIMDLGPSGFPFEKYISEILKHQGYTTSVNELIKGRCVTHEVDVLAMKDSARCMVECKFHNTRGIKCDVKVPLYIQSRFKDIEATWLQEESKKKYVNEGWVLTNTRFSPDAIRYGECAGLKLIGWNYPYRGSLQHWIEDSGLYPVTCLTLLTKAEKEEILANGTVLCRDIPDRQYLFHKMGIHAERLHRILAESAAICKSVKRKTSHSKQLARRGHV